MCDYIHVYLYIFFQRLHIYMYRCPSVYIVCDIFAKAVEVGFADSVISLYIAKQVHEFYQNMAKKRNINNDTALKTSVDEHFHILMNDKSFIEHTDVELNINDLPPWYNENLFKAGQQFTKNNVLGVGMGAFSGLLSVLTIQSTLDTLIATKQSSTPCTAFKRYAQTLMHVHKLYRNNINDATGVWWKSLNTIRRKHKSGGKISEDRGAGNISQRDMGLTQFGFLGYLMIAPEKLGISCKPIELEGFNHLWRVVGYLLGISDKTNICRPEVKETIELCQKISTDVYVDLIKSRSEICRTMISTLIDGFTCIDFTLNEDASLHLWYELNGMKYDKPLSVSSKLNIMYGRTIIYLFGVPLIGPLVRSGFNYYLDFNYWVLERWPILANIRFGTKQSKLNLYPYHK